MLIKDARALLEIEKRWNEIPKTKAAFFNAETGESVTGTTWGFRLKKARQVMEDYAAQVELDFGPDTPIPFSRDPDTDADSDSAEDLDDGCDLEVGDV